VTAALLPSIRLVDAMNAARRESASDVHLVPGSRPAIRVDGELQFLSGTPLGADETAAIAACLLTEPGVERVRAGEDVSTSWSDGKGPAARVHALRTTDGIALAIRILRDTIPTMEELRLPGIVASLARLDRGLIVFCGPTGSGKSTSMAAIVAEMNRCTARRIVTIEDPIEYRHTSEKSLVTQRGVGRDTTSFAAAVNGALRADPDVIVIGEMRETETMGAALAAAETGHVVLTTLHTGSAVQSIDRILDAFAGVRGEQMRAQLAAGLTAVVCQRLVPNARVPGRRPIVEVLLATDAVRSMIRDGRSHLIQNAMATGRNAGMQTFEQHARELVAAGEILP
jgi:twitching motility protein PilT